MIVHMSGANAVLLTGGVVPENLITSVNTFSVSSASARFISARQAATIALNVAAGTVANETGAGAISSRLRAAAAQPDARMLARAGAATATPRMVRCSGNSKCQAAYKQVVFVPSTRKLKARELHVYVNAVNGAVLSSTNRLRTAAKDVAPTNINGNSLYSGQVPIKSGLNSADSKKPFVMVDTRFNSETYDMMVRGWAARSGAEGRLG